MTISIFHHRLETYFIQSCSFERQQTFKVIFGGKTSYAEAATTCGHSRLQCLPDVVKQKL